MGRMGREFKGMIGKCFLRLWYRMLHFLWRHHMRNGYPVRDIEDCDMCNK